MRARVSIRPVVRRQFRVEWEYDGRSLEWDEEDGPGYVPARRTRVRHVNSLATAYRMAAMRLIFSKRDTLATGTDSRGYPSGCRLCDETHGGPEDPGFCRYHGGDGFEELRKRLARWLRWRDRAHPEQSK